MLRTFVRSIVRSLGLVAILAGTAAAADPAATSGKTHTTKVAHKKTAKTKAKAKKAARKSPKHTKAKAKAKKATKAEARPMP